MNQKSDIAGVVYCTFAALFGIGAGLGCYAGLMEIINHHPNADVVTTVAAGGFCLLMVAGIVQYVIRRRGEKCDREDAERTN